MANERILVVKGIEIERKSGTARRLRPDELREATEQLHRDGDRHEDEGTPRRSGRLLRRREVEALTGLSRPTLWRLERAGRFPKRVQISDNAVGWYEAEVLAWNENRPRAK